MKFKVVRLTAVATLVALGGKAQAALPNGVAAGDVSQTSAVLWGRSNTAGDLYFQYATDSAFTQNVGSSFKTVNDPLAPVKWDVSGLSADTTYYYRAIDSVGAIARGQFKTAAALGNTTGLRFGVSGDWRGELLPYPAVKNASQRNLDFFVAMGDTIYGDVASNVNGGQQQAQSLADYRNKHAEVYSAKGGMNGLADLRQSTAVFATIDDHEVTNDFAGGADVATDARFNADPAGTRINDSTLYNNGIQAFQEYNPLRNETYGATGDIRTAGEVKLYRNQTFGNDAALMVLDARSFRDKELADANPLSQASVGGFLANSFDPSRTMLGKQQIADLKADLLSDEQNDVTWKFIAVTEPMQNLGVVGAGDRFEGYAAERTEILKFIDDNKIDNVVFLSADIHGTLVNNLTYQLTPFGEQKATNAFEITTGSVAYDAPFGPTVAQLAAAVGLLTPQQKAFYDTLPSIAAKDSFIKSVTNGALTPLGYDPLGLDANLASADGKIQAELLQGDYVATHTFGWTEFEIDQVTQQLLVTTYGIPAYNVGDIANDLSGIVNRTPQIVSQFRITPSSVQPVPVPGAAWLFGSSLLGLAFGKRKKA
ncbi:alkaline phosphatase D family protein [Methylomonas sp. OY6]|uniref:Alkaline phosphatase D family protein n=1 Tax=Methylomonas defluvii TaxID=3045149 RepID=A0ABU4UMH8_9GAMM|nr:alkaline phosphatase D family protein [Methylomonas sp. OY6]MDX8129884.1 alkaline phosphatase D family protein [Methylomonas sp. OY6]